MRALILPAMALALAGTVVLVGGRMVEGPAGTGPVAIEQPDAETIAAAEGILAPPDANSSSAEVSSAEISPTPLEPPPASDATAALAPAEPQTEAPLAPEAPAQQVPWTAEEIEPPPTRHLAPSRMVAPAVIAPPELSAGEELLREAPREPLSRLSLALPPPPPPEFKNPWAGKPLFRPVAMESAVFESGGHTIAIEGVKSVPVDESCIYEDVSWPCGVKARAAFRLWLRGRALVCQIPEAEQEKDVMRAGCRLAKEDVGAWLVENGWALAAPDGPYVQAEEKARVAKIGIFGAPPDTSSLSDVPDAPASALGETLEIMTEEGVDPQPSLVPQAEHSPRGEFPPAPPVQ